MIPLAAHGLAFVAVLAEILTRAVKIKWSAAALRIPLRLGTSLRVCLGGDFGALGQVRVGDVKSALGLVDHVVKIIL